MILLSSLVGYISYLWIKRDAPVNEDIIDVDRPKLQNLLYLFLGIV